MLSRVVRFAGTVRSAEAGGFIYLPFNVPEWAKTIEVEYSYRGLGPGECTVDIGVFEPGPLDLIEAMTNFRGWSGSSRRSFYISESSATPGYLPGPLKPGVWHIVLGLYKIPAEGCAYEVVVRVSDAPRSGGQQLRAASNVCRKRGWVKGDFHVHSVHSDGDSTLEEVAERARERGLDFVAVTDHNTHSHIAQMGSGWVGGVLLVRGVELTTYRGHLNVYGFLSTPEFRIRSYKDLLRVVEQLRGRGALISVNHPKPLGPDWEWGSIGFAHFVEVYHSVWGFNNYISLKKWDEELRRGLKLGLVGGSDVHKLKSDAGVSRIGSPTTWLHVDELSEKGVLEALLRQRVFVSEDPSGPRVMLQLQHGQTLYQLGDSAPAARSFAIVRVERGEGRLARLVSDSGVEHVCKVQGDPYVERLEVDLRDRAFLRLEVLNYCEDPWDPYHRENDIAAITAPILIEHQHENCPALSELARHHAGG
ncbi:MAG: CehA/McbA family metallohydrolase [Thermofilaceae archaeon]